MRSVLLCLLIAACDPSSNRDGAAPGATRSVHAPDRGVDLPGVELVDHPCLDMVCPPEAHCAVVSEVVQDPTAPPGQRISVERHAVCEMDDDLTIVPARPAPAEAGGGTPTPGVSLPYVAEPAGATCLSVYCPPHTACEVVTALVIDRDAPEGERLIRERHAACVAVE